MQAVNIDTQEAPVKWFAAQDARMRSAGWQSTYSQQQQNTAERVKIGLEMVYKTRASHIAYGKYGISIKLEDPAVADRKNLKLLEQDYVKVGIVKKASTQGIIYRIKRWEK
jgi:hypothetical protein